MPQQRATKVRLRSSKGRRAGSTRWLERHINDRFVQSAREQGYRSRAAYKLLEIDERFGLLRPGGRILDLGSAPGGWVQVAAARGCRVVGVDLQEVEPVAGASLLQGDIFDRATIARLRDLAGGPVEVVLSDLAAPATGQRTVDRLRAEALAEEVLALLPEVLAPGGSAVVKLLRGAESAVVAAARQQFTRVKLIRTTASRTGSSETYLVGTGYRRGQAAD
ncbi:MAG TPA: RlmE family RNA methyltransferase [Geminicoccaceae bacterium]|nr:RlmE family RNA methyltransferase [Geminicoccaceae bacterium]